MLNGLDTSLEHIGVLMEAPTFHAPAGADLPEGYRFKLFETPDALGWCLLQLATGQIDDLEVAATIIHKEFLSYPEVLSKRVLLVMAPDGSIAASAALWFGTHLGEERPRIHWVATHPAHQNKGLAKAMMAELSLIYTSLGLTGTPYLTTQTWSWRAVGLYLQCGFVPYLGPCPNGWKTEGEPFETQNLRAWQQIYEKLGLPFETK